MSGALARLAAVVAALVLGGTAARAAEPFDVYVLAVGSSHYAPAPEPGLNAFGPIPGANKSARTVAELFARRGAAGATVLTSSPDRFVTKADVDTALDAMADRIAHDRPKRPLLVFYFAGHGVGEGFAWNLFAVPGEIVARNEPQRLALDSFSVVTLHAASLVERLQRTGAPFVVFLDTCYEGDAATFVNAVLSAQTSAALGDISAGLRKLNAFEGPNPVFFSAEPGQTVATVPDPRNPEAERVAPLARRLLQADAAAQGQELSLQDLIIRLGRADLDPATSPPITYAVRQASWAQRVWSAPGVGREVERKLASGVAARVCCDPPPPLIQQPLKGFIEISGPSGEFVSDGRTWRLVRGVVAVAPAENGALRLDVDGEADHWSVTLQAPNGAPLRPGRYVEALRWPAEDDARPGFSVSGAGRGCNASKGEFTIEALRWSATDRLAEVAFSGRQFCDDLTVPLTVRGRLEAVR